MPALQLIALETTTPQLRAPASGDTYSAPRALDITPETLTGSSATSSLSIAQTWNTTGTPTAIDLNVTDTASNAASLLMNLRVGGSSVASIRKNGIALFGPTAAFVNGIGVGTPALNVGAGANVASNFAGGQVNVWDNNINVASLNSTGVVLRSAATVSWGSGTSVGSVDTILARDAANTLAQRNGVNAQAFNIYNTYTDASNYERGFVRWSSNVLQIGCDAAGTGTNRLTEVRSAAQLDLYTFGARRVRLSSNGVNIDGSAGSGKLLWITDNANDIGASGANRPRNAFWGGYQEMSEMTAPAAPAANGVRIYAEDNGAGKTRLMALFATGVAQQLAVEP